MFPPHLTNGGAHGNGNGSTTVAADPGRHGGALVPVGQYPLAPLAPWAAGGPTKPPALSAGPTPVSLIHSFRRRWLPATVLGLLAGIATALCTWFFAPLNTKVEAIVQITKTPPTVMLSSQQSYKDTLEFDRFKTTQANLLVSTVVLNAAARRPEIAQLPTLRAEVDKIGWLAEEISVSQPQSSEYMFVSMSGDRPDDLVKIVNAVTQEYVSYTNGVERRKKNTQVDQLRVNVAEQRKLLDDNTKKYKNLAQSVGAVDKEQASIRSKLLFDQLAGHQASVREARSNLMRYDAQLADTNRMIELEKQKTVSEADIDSVLQQHPEIGPKFAYRNQVRLELTDLAGRLQNPQSSSIYRQKELQVQQAEDELRIAKDQMRASIEERLKSVNLGPLEFNKASLEASIATCNKTIEDAGVEIEKLRAQIQNITDNSADLEGLKNEVEQYKLTWNRIQSELVNLEVELKAPDRVTLVQEAVPPTTIDRTLKYVIVGFFGFTGVALAVFGVSFLEFQARRVSDTQDVADGLGLRVVGSLPRLRGAGASKKKGPSLHGLLSASVDTVRTALLHSAQADGTRVVLVTSAGDGEGRTTLASQLAASIARAGKRTLLIDADLRSPTIHRLFDLPLDPGLCEVLRGEADLDDVIHPTRAAGLWMISAGSCCQESVQLLAHEVLRKSFDRLRPDFDFIILDGAPVLALPDSLLIGQLTDAAILSVMRDVSQLPKVYEAAEKLRSVGIRVFGTVVHGLKPVSQRRSLDLPVPAGA